MAEELHFARAAERLGMEQSPLSHSIRNLETDLGVALFHRTTRRTWLTRAGTRFYTEAVRVLEAAEAAKAIARNEDGDGPKRLTIGLAEHAAGEPFTRFLFELEQRSPPISTDLREIAAGEAVRLIVERALDMAIVLESVDAPTMGRERAWAESLSLIAPLGHALAEQNQVSLSILEGECLISPSVNVAPGCAAQIDAVLERHGVRPGKRASAKHQNTLISFVSAGRGLALLPESIAHGLTSVAVLPLEELGVEIVSWILYRAEDESDAVAFALEVASVIDLGGDLPSEAAEPF